MPSIVSNAVDLIQDVLTWILILIPISGGAMLAWHAWMKQLNDGDSSEVAMRNKKMKNVIIASIIAMSASGIVQLILSYF